MPLVWRLVNRLPCVAPQRQTHGNPVCKSYPVTLSVIKEQSHPQVLVRLESELFPLYLSAALYHWCLALFTSVSFIGSMPPDSSAVLSRLPISVLSVLTGFSSFGQRLHAAS